MRVISILYTHESIAPANREWDRERAQLKFINWAPEYKDINWPFLFFFQPVEISPSHFILFIWWLGEAKKRFDFIMPYGREGGWPPSFLRVWRQREEEEEEAEIWWLNSTILNDKRRRKKGARKKKKLTTKGTCTEQQRERQTQTGSFWTALFGVSRDKGGGGREKENGGNYYNVYRTIRLLHVAHIIEPSSTKYENTKMRSQTMRHLLAHGRTQRRPTHQTPPS